MKKSKDQSKIFSLPQIGIQLQQLLVSTFLMFFFTDFLPGGLVSIGAITTLLFVGRIWDALDDPLTGYIVDNVYKGNKKGKFTPMLRFSGIFASIFFALFYTTFGLTGTGFVVYLYIVHIVGSVLGTLLGIAYPSLAASATQDPHKRTVLSTWKSVGGLIGGMTATLATYPLMRLFGGENQALGFTRTVWLYAIISIILFVVSSYYIKEKVEVTQKVDSAERLGFFKSIRVLFNNKVLLIVSGLMILNILALNVRAASNLYYLKYYLNNEYLIGLFSAISSTVMILAIIFVSPLAKKWGKKNMVIIAAIMNVVSSLIFIINPTNMIVAITATVIVGLSLGLGNVSLFSLQMDTITYNEWKSGKRQEGMIWSYLGIISKIAFSLSPVVVGLLLISSSYDSSNITPEAIRSIGIAFIYVPLILGVLASILAFMIPVDEAKISQMEEEIARR